MNKNYWRNARMLLVVGLALAMTLGTAGVASAAGELDFTMDTSTAMTPDSDGVYSYKMSSGVVWQRLDNKTDATGSGTFHSFLRIQAKENERGYNTDYRYPKNPVVQFEAEKNAEFNRSIALSAVPQVTWEGKYYREFQLDINESERYISLDHFQLWWSPIQDPYDYSLSTYSFPSSMGMALLYDQTAEDAGATLKLDYMVNAGSGKRDYAILLPENMFGGRTEGYIVLFAEHGLTHTTDDGFEEWGVEVYAAPEQLTVAKTVNTEFTRTHKWLIDKWVETDNGDKLEDGTPKIWLLEGYNESEDAYWYVDVDYDGYEDSAHRVYGTVTIENTGTVSAAITDVSDLLSGTSIPVSFGVTFPYTLPAGQILIGSYSALVDGQIEGYNGVTVVTQVGSYTGQGEIVWGAPASEVNETVHISDLSDLFGSVALGTVTAPNGDTFNYSKEFKRPDYSGEQHLTFNNTATIVETGQNDSAVLKVNKLDEELAVTKTVETSYTLMHKWQIEKHVETENDYALEDGTPKVWLYTDGHGDETATWYVDVLYKGTVAGDFTIGGTITIENTGTQDAVITSLEDVLAGVTVPVTWSWPEGTMLPYTLKAGETLTGTYIGSISSMVEGKNIINVITEVDTYSGEAEISWSDPVSEVNATVHIKDLSDLFGEVDLGTVGAPHGKTIAYDEYFSYAEYAGKGEHQAYNNKAWLVETGQYATALLKVNVQQLKYDTAWRFGNIQHDKIISTNNWGWSEGPLSPSETAYRQLLYSDAGKNDTTKGKVVGYVDVLYWNDEVKVTYVCDPGCLIKEAHLWVGKTELPIKGKSMTNAPGQFPWPSKKAPGTWVGSPGAYTGWTITLGENDFETTKDGKIYVAAHGQVGAPDPSFGPQD